MPRFADWNPRGNVPAQSIAHTPCWSGIPPILSVPLLIIVALAAVVSAR